MILFAKLIYLNYLCNLFNIDAIYTADPRKDKTAEKISNITYKEILAHYYSCAGVAQNDPCAQIYCGLSSILRNM